MAHPQKADFEEHLSLLIPTNKWLALSGPHGVGPGTLVRLLHCNLGIMGFKHRAVSLHTGIRLTISDPPQTQQWQDPRAPGCPFLLFGPNKRNHTEVDTWTFKEEFHIGLVLMMIPKHHKYNQKGWQIMEDWKSPANHFQAVYSKAQIRLQRSEWYCLLWTVMFYILMQFTILLPSYNFSSLHLSSITS